MSTQRIAAVAVSLIGLVLITLVIRLETPPLLRILGYALGVPAFWLGVWLWFRAPRPAKHETPPADKLFDD